METEPIVNSSSTGFTGSVSVLNNVSTEHMVAEEAVKWTSAEIARLIQIIYRPILIIGGTVGNCLTVYIMRRTSLKHLSTCFYMVVLAVADSSTSFFQIL